MCHLEANDFIMMISYGVFQKRNTRLTEEQDAINMIQKYVIDVSDRLYTHQFGDP